MKILTIDDDKKTGDEARNVMQGKALLHTENFLLSLVKDMEGVIHAHEFFFDYVFEERLSDKNDRKPVQHIYTGRVLKRIVLVLDCVYSHEFDQRSCAYINLQQYVLRYKLAEWEQLNLFRKVVEVVEKLHRRNIIHRDLKLNNVILNRVSSKVCLVNFCLGKMLSSESSVFYEKRGTPAYIAPELLSGKPYKGKPCDMWSLGVMLYTMVVGQFPFLETAQPALFRKIKHAEFTFPPDKKVSVETKTLIESLLCLNPERRATAKETMDQLNLIIQRKNRRHVDQVVPEMATDESLCCATDKSEKSFKPGPTHELSFEQFSRTLEILATESRDKNFIRPNMLSVRRLRSSPTGLGSTPTPNSAPSTPSSGGDTGNVIFNLPDGRRTSLTHQIDNLSLHAARTHHQDPSAWHTRINALGTATNASPAVQSLFLALNELFTRGRLPIPRDTREFNGYLNQEISTKISTFLRDNCRTQELVRDVFTRIDRSDRSKVIELFTRFGVQMQQGTTNHHMMIKPEQSINNLMFLTFMMQISGYNNNYFLNFRP